MNPGKVLMDSTLRRGMVAAVALAMACAAIRTPAVLAQEVRIERSAVTLSSGGEGKAEISFRLADGVEHRMTLANGEATIDGTSVGGYEADGQLVTRWRAFLREHAGTDPAALQSGLEDFAEGLAGWEPDATDGEVARSLGRRIAALIQTPEAAGGAPETIGTATATLNGSRLAIAPGGVAFDGLIGQLDHLRQGLRQLGNGASEETDHLALIVHDDFTVGRGEVIEGNLALLDGTLRLGGEVDGDVLILDGSLVLVDGARVEGDILQVGGELELKGGARAVEGEIVSDFPSAAAARSAPEVPGVDRDVVPAVVSGAERNIRHRSNPVRRFARNLAHAGEGLMGAFTTFITLGVLGWILVYFAQARVERVADTVRHEFARSLAMGLAGEVLFFPAVLILCVLVITLPIVPFFVLGMGLAMLAGYVAVAHGAGEMFAQRRYRYEWLERLRRSNSYYYVLSGLVVLLLPFAATAVLWVLGGTAGFVRGMVAFVAAVGTWILVTAGFGGVLLTRAGTRSVVVDWSEGTVDFQEETIADAAPAHDGDPDEPDA